MNPNFLRLLMVFVGLLCFVAIHFVPEQRELLLAAGVGLLGWAKAAPGHDGSSSGGSLAPSIAFAMFVPFAVSACGASLPRTPAEGVRVAFDASRRACRVYEGTGGIRDDVADQLCLALLLGDRATVVVEPEPPGDAGSK
jgi:hypothetical protein